MKVVKELQDLRYLNWSKVRHSSGTAGTLLKAEENSKEGKKTVRGTDTMKKHHCSFTPQSRRVS